LRAGWIGKGQGRTPASSIKCEIGHEVPTTIPDSRGGPERASREVFGRKEESPIKAVWDKRNPLQN